MQRKSDLEKKCFICNGKGYTRPDIFSRLLLAPFTFGASLIVLTRCPICTSTLKSLDKVQKKTNTDGESL